MVTISVNAKNQIEAQAILSSFFATTGTSTLATAKTTTTKKAAAVQVDEEITETEDETSDLDLGIDDEEVVVKKITLETVIQAFKVYAQKNGRDKAARILGKYGVKSVRDLKADTYEKVLKTLG